MLGQECTEGKVAIYKSWREAWDRLAPSEGAWPCPYLDLGLLTSSTVSNIFLQFKPPSFWYFATTAPGNSQTGVGASQKQGSVHGFVRCYPSWGLFPLYLPHDGQYKTSITSINTMALKHQ